MCLLRLLRWIPAFAGMTWRGFVFMRKLAHDLDNAGADAEGAKGTQKAQRNPKILKKHRGTDRVCLLWLGLIGLQFQFPCVEGK